MRRQFSILLLMAVGLQASSQEAIIVKLFNRWQTGNKLVTIPAQSISSVDSTADIPREIIRTTDAFLITAYEVSNAEYRRFVHYVRDSIAHTLLNHYLPDTKKLNWSARIDWTDLRLSAMMVQEEWSSPRLNPEVLLFSFNGKNVAVYPDTLVWMSDFNYSYNEPLVKKYFTHPEYDKYPVVGVNYFQAAAFCEWRSAELTHLLVKNGFERLQVDVSLPTVAEWNAAAGTGDNSYMDLLFKKGGYSMNAGQIIDQSGTVVKDYDDDGYQYTAPVNKFTPNQYGVYNSYGNVAEWISPGNMYSVHDKQMTEVRGGSWESEPAQIMNSSKKLLPSAAHSYLGFRYVVRIRKVAGT
jgi:formylglycine-generating enzyme